MRIAYKTREMQTPQGLSRVWFCAHPSDYDKYLEALCSEILSITGCAVWYDSEPSAPYERVELIEIIESMNLVVVPITHSLIFSKNRAADLELDFAIKAHVPILPILIEPCLEMEFNKKFGSLQLLDRTDSDKTSKIYTEKLVRFLSETLTDEELTEKIRKAFDAYIFLSYRKKDRQYAKELMKLIHKNDFCRDVAIWYDEFLLPGENFNDSIINAISKSDLFILNVTPGILEKTIDSNGNECDNYILATEYPFALESKKTVLPAEAVDTDKSALAKRYRNLPACVSVRDEAALNERLQCAFDKIALRQSNDPQHNFFIGLAYLNGIDVEKDHTLAVSLIESAADEGITQAIEKLVCMYQNGEGVSRDAHLEEKWRRRLIAHRRKQLDKSHDAWDAHTWLCEIMSLGDLFMRTRQLPSAKKEYYLALQTSKDLLSKFPNPLAEKDVSSALYRLGTLAQAEKRLNEAAKYYTESFEISKKFTEKSSSFLVKRNYARDVIALARIFEANEDYAQASDGYVKAYSILSEACKKNDFSFLRAELAYTCERLGSVENMLGRPVTAKQYYLEALSLYRQSTYMSESLQPINKVASVLAALGNLARDESDTATAIRCYSEAIDVYITISNQDPKTTDLEELALTYCKLATVTNENEAASALKKSLAVYERLHIEYPQNEFYAECINDIAECLTRI